jgi:hypothetical protein
MSDSEPLIDLVPWLFRESCRARFALIVNVSQWEAPVLTPRDERWSRKAKSHRAVILAGGPCASEGYPVAP